MPQLRQYISQEASRGGASLNVRATPQGPDVSGLVRGVADAGDTLQRLKEAQDREAKRLELDEARMSVENDTSEAQSTWLERLSEAKTKAPSAAAGFTDRLLKEYDTWSADRVKTIAHPEGSKLLQQRLLQLRQRLHADAFKFEVEQRGQALQDSFTDGLQADAATVAGDESRYGQALARRVATAQAIGVSASVREKMEDTARRGLAVAATRGLVERNPSAALTELDAYFSKDGASAAYVAALKPEQAAALRNEARTEVQRSVAGAKTELTSRARDLQAMVLAGVAPPADAVPSQDEAIKAFGPDGARWFQQEVQTYVQIGGAIGQMRSASPEERRAMIASATPPPGEGFAEKQRVHHAMLQAEAAIEKRLKDDPATYAMEVSPRVQKAQAVMSQVLKNTPEDTAAVVDFYARVQMAEQQRLGVAVPKLMTDAQAAGIVQQFNAQSTGGRNAASLVADLERTWGSYWPTVYGQLADAKLPPAALVIPNMKDAGARTRLAEWAAMKPADRDNLIPPADKADLRDKVLDQFSGAASSFLAQGGGGQRTISTVIDQANILAMGYRSQGRSVGDAAKQAFDEVMGWRYEFGDTYRIPKEERPADVQKGIASALRMLDNVKVLAPPSVEGAKDLTVDAIRANAAWVTNRDETGLRLMVKGQDGALYQVMDHTDKPVNMTWSNLRSAALTELTEEALKRPRPFIPSKR